MATGTIEDLRQHIATVDRQIILCLAALVDAYARGFYPHGSLTTPPRKLESSVEQLEEPNAGVSLTAMRRLARLIREEGRRHSHLKDVPQSWEAVLPQAK
ncbi:hypothetical protein COV04_03950 [Candidatus Uhrbacteria bacterium CG10_big_fil_rev_8_21_14_0_10_48_11]|uniref:Uncharacterized protein n=1 Tax=Candidatus Uhrbacteria bacterium CG10_big_fil_rev_8_21_14_0_10_48_11 TaxID=1975037 RepID=A0A2M8LDN2_9BACT|nr:MAG: hypothetical protein COV04_03950 [Candidatus Uhrbacteria bacterium CG10_big_fil_rev_8_21_14_0_10_48_11]